MNSTPDIKKKRGRPPRRFEGKLETRELLIRAGMDLLTEKGFIGTGIGELLEGTTIPKGSFYHYFKSKDEFGLEVLAEYGRYFDHLLDGYLQDRNETPLQRIDNFIAGAINWIKKHEFKRGCLIGNVGQEAGSLDLSFSSKLDNVFQGWQNRIAACLEEAKSQNEITSTLSPEKLAAFFWIGWEGAILRAKLVRSEEPLQLFRDVFFAHLQLQKEQQVTNQKECHP